MELGVKESNLVLKPFDPTEKIEIVYTDSLCAKAKFYKKIFIS